MDTYRPPNRKPNDPKRFFSLYWEESSDDCINKHDDKEHHESCVKKY